MSWASNLNPEDNWELHEGCQVVEFGGWPNGVVSIKTTAAPPLVDLLNMCIDDFYIIWLASFNEMIPGELQNFCSQVVEVCDTITTTDHKLIFGLKKQGPFLKTIEKNTNEFKSLSYLSSLQASLPNPNHS